MGGVEELNGVEQETAAKRAAEHQDEQAGPAQPTGRTTVVACCGGTAYISDRGMRVNEWVS